MWLRCDVCRRYARLNLAGLHDLDYRTKTFRCSRCGGEAYLAVVEPIKETGMGDYRLDESPRPSAIPPRSIGSPAGAGRRGSTTPAASCRAGA
jgi:hypothetical protein